MFESDVVIKKKTQRLLRDKKWRKSTRKFPKVYGILLLHIAVKILCIVLIHSKRKH